MRLTDIIERNFQRDGEEAVVRRQFLAYARVSTEDQERAGLSIPAQIREIENYARAQAIVIAEVYQDAQSAFSDESRRPEFWRMVDRAKRGQDITGILVHDSSRFFRDPYAGPMVKGELRAHGVEVVSVTEPAYDPRTVAGLAIEKMTEFKNASYSLDVAFHTRKGMKENIARRDLEIGYCYKNGGAPLWGFKPYKVKRGVERSGAAIMKTLWEKDDTIVVGRPVWEWARHALVEMRLNQCASLDHIRHFLNVHGVPSPRKRYWAISSWHSLLQPSALLQYAGYGVWNVHGKHGAHKPPSEWDIIENAHPAIITLEEAEAIMDVNERHSRLGRDRSKGRMASLRAQGSRYLLSGGLLVCKRCGANMVGFQNRGRLYYVCRAKVYRSGLGCGPALQVRKEEIETAVVEEIGQLFNAWTDPERLTQMVNEEIRALQQQQAAESVEVGRELARVEQELANLRSAIKAGLNDTDWANKELHRMKVQQSELFKRQESIGAGPEAPEMDLAQLEGYREQFAEVIDRGTNEEKRTLARLFVKTIEVDPDTGDVWMYLPERPMILQPNNGASEDEEGVSFGLVAGGGFEPPTFGL